MVALIGLALILGLAHILAPTHVLGPALILALTRVLVVLAMNRQQIDALKADSRRAWIWCVFVAWGVDRWYSYGRSQVALNFVSVLSCLFRVLLFAQARPRTGFMADTAWLDTLRASIHMPCSSPSM